MKNKPCSLAAVALQAEHAGIIGRTQIVQAERVALVGRESIVLQRHLIIAWLTAQSVLIEIAERGGGTEMALGGGTLIGGGSLIQIHRRAAQSPRVAFSLEVQGICEGNAVGQLARVETAPCIVLTNVKSPRIGKSEVADRVLIPLARRLAVPIHRLCDVRLYDGRELEIGIEQGGIEELGVHLAGDSVSFQRLHGLAVGFCAVAQRAQRVVARIGINWLGPWHVSVGRRHCPEQQTMTAASACGHAIQAARYNLSSYQSLPW